MGKLVPKTPLLANCPVKALICLSTASAGVLYDSIFHETIFFLWLYLNVWTVLVSCMLLRSGRFILRITVFLFFLRGIRAPGR